MPKSLRFAVVLKRYRLISAPLGNSKRFDSRRFSGIFPRKTAPGFGACQCCLPDTATFKFQGCGCAFEKKTLQDCMATTHTGIHLFDSTCMLASCINCQACSR